MKTQPQPSRRRIFQSTGGGLGLLALALTSDRFWPMYATAFQLVGLLVHIGSLTSAGGGMAWAYAVGLIFWSYAVIAALLAGTWLEGRNRRLAGL